MYYKGIVIGAASFLIIGLFHPIVIKCEYYFSKKVWPLFLILGFILIIISSFIKNQTLSSVIAITGFSCIWSIHEIFEQEQRVRKGWFPKNPKRNQF